MTETTGNAEHLRPLPLELGEVALPVDGRRNWRRAIKRVVRRISIVLERQRVQLAKRADGSCSVGSCRPCKPGQEGESVQEKRSRRRENSGEVTLLSGLDLTSLRKNIVGSPGQAFDPCRLFLFSSPLLESPMFVFWWLAEFLDDSATKFLRLGIHKTKEVSSGGGRMDVWLHFRLARLCDRLAIDCQIVLA